MTWNPPQRPARAYVPNMIPMSRQYTSAAMTWRPTAQDFTNWDPTIRDSVLCGQPEEAANASHGSHVPDAGGEPLSTWSGEHWETPENEPAGLNFVKGEFEGM
jgi:hypothetical protein